MDDTSNSRGGGLRLAALSVAAIGLPVVGLAAAGWLIGDDLAARLALPTWSAPLMAVAIALVCGLALLPTHLASLACGYLLGLGVGLPTAVAGVLGGAALGYWLARRIDAAALRQLAERRPIGRRLTEAMLDRGPAHATAAVALVRLPPHVPFALGNVLAASLRIRLRPMLIGTAIGMTPRVALVVWLGSELAAWDRTASPPMSLYLSIAATVVGLGGLTVWTAAALRAKRST
ncbi:MAG: VTT domain-containing protein [Planctomycetota bacterium]